MGGNLTWLFLSALVSAAVSALWSHLSKRSLQRDDNQTKIAIATLEDKFERSQRLGQAAIDRSIFVTRAHFETEFEAMKQVFSCLSALGFCVAAMRPLDASCPTQYEKDKRLNELRTAHNELNKLLEAKLPFYAVELYEPVKTCLKAAGRETDDLDRMKDPYDLAGRQRAESNQADFAENYDKAVDVIRERISRLAILPT